MRYPTHLGLAYSPYALGLAVPTPEQLQVRRLTTVHHGYWTKERYLDQRLRTVFRNLVTNVFPLIATEHQALHERFAPPPRPKDVLMIDVLEDYMATHGVIECIREKQTRSTYQIQPEDWASIKRGYTNGQTRTLGSRPSVATIKLES